eukprot:Colp12_sorted_trinity150504_noHs@8625
MAEVAFSTLPKSPHLGGGAARRASVTPMMKPATRKSSTAFGKAATLSRAQSRALDAEPRTPRGVARATSRNMFVETRNVPVKKVVHRLSTLPKAEDLKNLRNVVFFKQRIPGKRVYQTVSHFETAPQPPKPKKERSPEETILRAQITARSNSIAEYRKRCEQLQRENMQLKEVIERIDKDSSTFVQELTTGDKRKIVSVLHTWHLFEKELVERKQEAEALAKRKAAELRGLEREVERLQGRVAAQQKELESLMAFKAGEQFTNAAKISKLRAVVDLLEQNHAAHTATLRADFALDRANADDAYKTVQGRLEERAAEHAIEQLMDAGTRQLAMQNLVLRREMRLHEAELTSLEGAIQRLEVANGELQRENCEASFQRGCFPNYMGAPIDRLKPIA